MAGNKQIEKTFAEMLAEARVPPGATVLHVGAHHGEEDSLYSEHKLVPVYVEANPAAFAMLQKMHPKRRCVHALVTTSDGGTATLWISSPDVCSSPLPAIKKVPGIGNIRLDVQGIQVPKRTVDSICHELNVQPQVLVIDVQGAEWRVLSGATSMLKNISAIWCELWKQAIYQGTVLGHEIVRALRKGGFEMVRYVAGSSPAWGDGFFIRRTAK